MAEGYQGEGRDSSTNITTRTDIVPDHPRCLRPKYARVYKGVKQYPLSGVSMRYSFDAKPDSPTQKKRQYYAMLGTRGIWEDGWKAVALHAPLTGKGHFDQDPLDLYHTDVDRSESKDVSKEHTEKLEALKKAWFEEADKNLVLPLDDRTALEQLNIDAVSDSGWERCGLPEFWNWLPVDGQQGNYPRGLFLQIRSRTTRPDYFQIADNSAQNVAFRLEGRSRGILIRAVLSSAFD